MASHHYSSLIFIAILLCSATAISSSPEKFSSSIRLPSDKTSNLCGQLSLSSFSCPVNCFRANPVCGSDGVTYWCGCADATCAGVTVVRTGYCEVGNGGSGSFPGQALLLVHIVWLIIIGISVLFGLF